MTGEQGYHMNHLPNLRCNAVSFESDLCEEAHIMQLQEADAGETQKSFLIRSEEARFVYFLLDVILVRMLIYNINII